ncbi:MAG: feruloyl-CoA synthase [Geminicoccaceae bacterium]
MSTDYHPVRIGTFHPVLERRADGTSLLANRSPLPAARRCLGEYLRHWAEAAPDRTFIARRDVTGVWRTWSYGRTLARVERLASALLQRNLSPDRPIAILSGNDIEHALLALAAMHVGIPYVPVSPAYSLLSKDHAKLKGILSNLTPGLVFAADGVRFERALRAAVPADAEIVVTGNLPPDMPGMPFEDLDAEPDERLRQAFADIDGDTIAKFLMTSGSTGVPKAVINTQRMICTNQVQIHSVLAFLTDTPPVILDCLPWNHTFGGNHNFGITLVNGGSLHIDDGRPTAEHIGETVRNLRDIRPTVYFNVPKGYEELIPHLRADQALCENLFGDLEMLFFAGAGMAAHVWQALDELAVRTTGRKVTMLTGLGATETAPFALNCDPSNTGSGRIGLPVPGVTLKLVPSGQKLEVRIKGPNVTPGYWRQPELTAAAFDEEGFYCLGDAVRFVDEEDLSKGLAFDGRVAEDFKLATGTWISTGPLRAAAIAALAPYARDVVVCAPNRNELGLLVVADPDATAGKPAGELREALRLGLAELNADATGSSKRVMRLMLLDEPLSIDRGEVTDKGSINQRAVLENKPHLVDELYAGSARVILP